MKRKLFFVLLFLISLLVGCDDSLSKNKLENYLFSVSGEKAYEIEGTSQSIDGMKEEFYTFVDLNFPSNLKEFAKISKDNWREFIERRQKQDMIIIDSLKSNLFEDKVFNYFLRQGLRDAIVKAYLYKQIPNVEKIKDAQFSDDSVYLEEVYKKNKKSYDDKKISKDDAIKALKSVYLKKKRVVVDYLLQQEESKVMEQLKKKFKINENKDLIEKAIEKKEGKNAS